jgi:hypothetical protein
MLPPWVEAHPFFRTQARTARHRSFFNVPAAGPTVALAFAIPSGSVPDMHNPQSAMSSAVAQFCVSHAWQSGPPIIAMPPEPDEALEPPEPDPDAAVPPEPEELPPEPVELGAASLASALAAASGFASELALSFAASTTETSALASF